MMEIKERSCFIHVDVPGHADNAQTLSDSFQFPSLQGLGEDLVTVLDFLHVKYVIGLGEGAGANTLARFGHAHPSRCLGLILINLTGSAASVLDVFKNKVREKINILSCFSNKNCMFVSFQFISWKGEEMGQSAEDFLLYHKFGYVSMNYTINFVSVKSSIRI
jgi:protein NDRG1